MKVGQKLRMWDRFSASISLTHEGQSKIGTLGGGIISLSIELLVLSYCIMRIIAVVSFQDPAISSYSIREERGHMNSINFSDYHQHLAFCLLDANNFRIEQIDPRFGQLQVMTFESQQLDTTGQFAQTNSTVELELISESKNDIMANVLSDYG